MREIRLPTSTPRRLPRRRRPSIDDETTALLLVPFVCVELGIQVWLFRSSKGRVPLPSCDILYIGDNERTGKDADPDPLPAGQPAGDVRPIQLADGAKRSHMDVVVVVVAAVFAV